MSLYDHPALYDRLLPAEQDCVRFYADLACESGGPVLELACGTGQLSASIGTIVGIDNSLTMLHHARRATNAQLLAADMRDFALRRKFALAFIARNSLLHLTSTDDLVRCLTNIRRHLADDGVFAFDIFNPNLAMLASSSRQRFRVMQVDDVIVEETRSYDAATQVNQATWYVTEGEREVGAFPIHLRSIFPQELPLLLQHCGWQMHERFGGYDRSPFTPHSPRQVVICG